MSMQALKEAGLKPAEITDVILVGGSARIPYIQQQLREAFPGREPRADVNPDEAVAVGAALYADALFRSVDSTALPPVRLRDVTPLSLGVEVTKDGFSVIVPRNSPLPISFCKSFTTTVDNAVRGSACAHRVVVDLCACPFSVPLPGSPTA